MIRSLALSAVLVFVRCACDRTSRVVHIDQGPVRGTLNSKGFFEFFGIPYATAPKGEHKFKAPLTPPSWTDVLNANRPVSCPQVMRVPGVPNLSEWVIDEDCLVVNIFVPNTEKIDLPVLVYIHAGAFMLGNGYVVNHAALLKQELIVINFNYRLGVRGFLCLGTKAIPGNAGMKDQVAALRWIQKNIEKFGGNPKAVTIAGYSAGSAAVEHLMLSNVTRGLFTKVIPESGSALSPWAIQPDPIAVAKRYMKDISGKTTDDMAELEDFYKSLSEEQLVEKVYFSEPDSDFAFVPCVESSIDGEESFFTEPPIEILKRGDYNKIPIMPGFASEEGLFRIGEFDVWSVMMNEEFSDFLPNDLAFKSEEEKKHVAEQVKKFYFKDCPVSNDNIRQYVNYFSDVLVVYPAIKAAKLHAQNRVPVFLYEFSYVHSTDVVPQLHNDQITGASHCAQTGVLNPFLLFGDVKYSDNDSLVQNRLATMWANFVKYGKPIIEQTSLLPVSWSRLEPGKLNYLHIDLRMEAREGLLANSVAFWDSIYRDYYRAPSPPGRSNVYLGKQVT